MKNGFVINGIKHYTPRETIDLCSQGNILVDVREEYMIGHKCFDVENLIFCSFSTFEENYGKLPKDKLLIFADSTGLKSKEATNFCKDKGLENIANLAGGLVEWERNGFPVATNAKERLSGSCMCQIKYRNTK